MLRGKVTQVYTFEGLTRKATDVAQAGEVVNGLGQINLGRIESGIHANLLRKAEAVGVETSGRRAEHLIVMHHELDSKVRRQIEVGHDLVVPVAGPAFVHDLGLDLREEVSRLFMDDGQ